MAVTTTLNNKKMAFGVETEAVANTAETIVTGDVFKALEPSITVNNNMQEDPGARTTRGKHKGIPGGQTCDVSFGAFEKGSGTLGTAPASPIMDAHLAAGFAQTNYASIRQQLDLGDTDASMTCQIYKGRIVGATSKSVIARGCKVNLTTTLEPGQAAIDTFEGNGVFSTDADAVVLAKGGEDTTLEPTLVSAGCMIGEISSVSTHASDGTQEEMADAPASNLKYAVAYTPTRNETVIGYAVKMEKVGTPANETNGFTIAMDTDAAGDPAGSLVTNTTVNRATTIIAAADEWEFFALARGSRGALVSATPYHILMTQDWDPDGSNTLKLDVEAVAAGSQKTKFYDASWAALALKNISVVLITMPSGGDDLLLGTSEINMNNEISVTPDDPNDAQGHAAADLTDADPTWSISPRDTIDSEVDLGAYITAGTELFVQMTVGSTSGNKIQHTMSRLTVEKQEPGVLDNKIIRGLTLRLNREKTGAYYTKRYM